VSTKLHGFTPQKTTMFITKEVITLIVPYILLVRTYDAVQLILYVGCGGIIAETIMEAKGRIMFRRRKRMTYGGRRRTKLQVFPSQQVFK